MGFLKTIAGVVAAPAGIGADLVSGAVQGFNRVVEVLGGPVTKWTGVNLVLDVAGSTVSFGLHFSEATIRDLGNIEDINGWEDALAFVNPVNRGATIALSAALLAAEEILLPHARPIPPNIRAALAGRGLAALTAETLDHARYAVGDGQLTLPHVINEADGIFSNSANHAVTAGRVVLFRSEPISLHHWAHELHHVYQYRRWGIPGFAARYIRNWDGVEAEAETTAWAVSTGVTATTLRSWLDDERPARGWQLSEAPFLGVRPFLPPVGRLDPSLG